MSASFLSMPLVRYVLMSALRDRLMLALVLVVLVGTALSFFLGSAAMIEYDQFAIVFAAGGLRFAAVAGLILFVVFHMRRSFDSKDVDFLLSRPITRTAFIMSHALAFSILALAIGLTVAIAVAGMNPAIIGSGHVLWTASLLVELVIVANAALFFSMVITSAAGSALAVFGLYVLSRLMGQLLGIASVGESSAIYPLLKATMNVVSMVVPRLDLLTQTSWLIYPDIPHGIGYGFILAQGGAYVALLVCAALIDLRRRQF